MHAKYYFQKRLQISSVARISDVGALDWSLRQSLEPRGQIFEKSYDELMKNL